MAIAPAALAANPAKVELRPRADGVEAVFTLAEPVARFALEEAVADVRGDTWKFQTPGMAVAEGVVTRGDGAAFKTFSVLVTPDTAPRDRRYPALTRIGEGWQVYGPYFKSAEGEPPIEGHVAAAKGWTVVPAGKDDRAPLDGYFYVGPSSYVTDGPAAFVAAPGTPATLRDGAAKAASAATAYYTQRLAVALPDKPTVTIALIPQFETGWQGDTTPGYVASLRFFGSSATGVLNESDSRQATRFVAHEFFHFWNNRTFRSRDGANEAWLHEGMAEYAALLASRQSGAITEAQVAESLGERTTACANALKAKGMAADPPRRGRAIYDCGVLIQWIADLRARRDSQGARDVFDLWRELFAEAGRYDGTYDGEAFLKRAGRSDAADEPLGLLMRPGEPDRWTRLTARLEDMGAAVTPVRSAQAERQALVIHVLDQVCNGSRGYYGGDPTALKLDTTTNCGVLNGDPVIDAIAGHDIMTDVHAAFDAAVPICAAGGEVALERKGQLVAKIACKKPMPPRPLAWTVERWR